MSHLEKFLSLPVEKQNLIIDAALKTFAMHGYKKTSINDIAKAAEISKAMVFHYFGTKKDLYLYLIDVCIKDIMAEVKEKFDDTITDVFDRIMLAIRLEISLIQKHPSMISFIKNAYFEKDDEVQEDIKKIFSNSEGYELRKKIVFDGADFSKFKEDIDPQLVMNIIGWLAEGYMSEISDEKEIDLDELYKRFEECMQLFKRNFYK